MKERRDTEEEEEKKKMRASNAHSRFTLYEEVKRERERERERERKNRLSCFTIAIFFLLLFFV